MCVFSTQPSAIFEGTFDKSSTKIYDKYSHQARKSLNKGPPKEKSWTFFDIIKTLIELSKNVEKSRIMKN